MPYSPSSTQKHIDGMLPVLVSARGLTRPSSCQRKRFDQVADAVLEEVKLTHPDGARGIRDGISMQDTPLRKTMLAAAGSDRRLYRLGPR